MDVWSWPLRVGRALDNDLVIDDPFVAPHHALIAPGADGTLAVQVLESRNGVRIEGAGARKRQHVAAGQSAVLPAGGARLELGATRLVLRLPNEELAPERPLPPGGARAGLMPALMALALLLLVVAEHWVETDPGADTTTWLPLVTVLPLMVAMWCGAWALMSKLFQHRFEFGAHLRIALPWLVAVTAINSLWPQVAAALGAPLMWRGTTAVNVVVTALMVRAHLTQVLPQHPRRVTAALTALVLVGAGVSLAVNQRTHDRWTSAPYMSTLPLPAVRLAGTDAPAALVQDIGPLAERLAERARKAREEDAEAGEDFE